MAQRAEDLGAALTAEEYRECLESILKLKTMPSMRGMMTAGRAAERDNVALYNCAACSCSHPKVFSEALYILACGAGFAYSVERGEVNKLPPVPEYLVDCDTVLVCRDSKIGWGQTLQALIDLMYNGQIPRWDLSKVRPAGARLKTFGGRSSGGQVFDELLHFVVAIFRKASADGGRKLTSLEVHGIICKIGETIVVGGTRRSACLSLSNLSDDRMRNAKMGNWAQHNPHFSLANNSVAYTERPEMEIFMAEWLSLVQSKSGERGIFNRKAAQNQAKKTGRRNSDHDYITNSCAEVILKNTGQFCNLSEVICRPDDTWDTLKSKIRVAAIFGVLQSTFTKFRYLREIWRRNTEEERLLGISMTGIMDCPRLNGTDGNLLELEKNLEGLRKHAVDATKEWCDRFGLNMSASVSCLKPSGTCSLLVDCSPGIHPRYDRYYIRRYQETSLSPISKMLIDQGIPHEKLRYRPSDYVFEFPVRAPDTVRTRHDMSAMDQLELWLAFKRGWAEHAVSQTIYVRDHEWLKVGAWVYEHFDEIVGLSFLPWDGGSYVQAPFEAIDLETCEKLENELPAIDWSQLGKYELEDETTGSQELACTGGQCLI